MLDWTMYEFHIALLNNPSFWLRDDNGIVVKQSGDSTFPQPSDGMLVFDYRQSAVIDFFLSECLNMTASPAIDGCFVDRADQELTAEQFQNYSFSDADISEFQKGHDSMLKHLQNALG